MPHLPHFRYNKNFPQKWVPSLSLLQKLRITVSRYIFNLANIWLFDEYINIALTSLTTTESSLKDLTKYYGMKVFQTSVLTNLLAESLSN